MSWEVAIYGELKFAPGEVEKWKNMIIPEKRFEVFCTPDYNYLKYFPFKPKTVEACLRNFPEEDGYGKDDYGLFINPIFEKEKFIIHGCIHKDSYSKLRAIIAILFGSASEFKAEGNLVFAGITIDIAECLEVKNGELRRFDIQEDIRDLAWSLVCVEEGRKKPAGEFDEEAMISAQKKPKPIFEQILKKAYQ